MKHVKHEALDKVYASRIVQAALMSLDSPYSFVLIVLTTTISRIKRLAAQARGVQEQSLPSGKVCAVTTVSAFEGFLIYRQQGCVYCGGGW